MDTSLIYFLNSDGPQKNSTVLCNIYSSTFNLLVLHLGSRKCVQ